jgi:hypothetical protein
VLVHLALHTEFFQLCFSKVVIQKLLAINAVLDKRITVLSMRFPDIPEPLSH